MTLDEAIKKEEGIAEEKFNNAVHIMDKMKSDIALENAEEYKQCAEEHQQLAEWLKDYKRLLEQERKTGHWIDTNYHHYYNDGDIETTELRCSCCNEEVEWDIELLHKPNYCENCGTDMREVEE